LPRHKIYDALKTARVVISSSMQDGNKLGLCKGRTFFLFEHRVPKNEQIISLMYTFKYKYIIYNSFPYFMAKNQRLDSWGAKFRFHIS